MSRDDSETTSTEENRFAERRARMVERQLRRRGIRDERVLKAMAQVPREHFVPGDERVLEVGTGSGYAAAVLSRLCREVVTVERFETLAEEARRRLAELGYDNVEVRVGDGSLGAPDRAPFGGISVTATAHEDPPAALFDQLEPGAALVCPVERGGRELLMRFRDGGEEGIVPVRFVPLVEG